jgi:hypothetical protein
MPRCSARIAALSLAGWLAAAQALGQSSTATSLPGARVANPASTSATFSLGLSKTNGASFESSALTSDNIRLIGTIRPEATQINQKADIYVVAAVGPSFYMRNLAGEFVPWDGQVGSLLPFRSQETLTAALPVDFLTGQIPVVATLQLFMGYKAADGVLTYTQTPLQISVSAPPVKSARELATDAYAATVSSLVQSNPPCIACHVSGGLANSSGLRFVPTSNANHLSLNFAQFESLVQRRGRSYILTTVLGGNDHAKPIAGGAQFRSTDLGYRNLDAFLQLVEKL